MPRMNKNDFKGFLLLQQGVKPQLLGDGRYAVNTGKRSS
jgi:hypothetical protein